MSSASTGRFLALALTGALVFLANLATPLWADDHCRAMGADLGEALRLASVEYGTWSGRFLVSGLTYALMGDGIGVPWLFVTLNSAAFVGLVRLLLALAAMAGGGRSSTGESASRTFAEAGFAALALWWLPWSIAETALWRSGSVGYLWAVLAELLVLFLVLRTPRAGLTRRVAVALLAFAAATMLETAALATTLALALLCLHRRRAGTGRLPWLETGAHALGFLVSALAPGNRARTAFLDAEPGLDGLLARLGGTLDLAGRLVDGWGLAVLALAALGWWLSERAARRPIRDGLRAGRGWLFPAGIALYLATTLFVPAPAQAARLSFPASVLLAGTLAAILAARPARAAADRIFAGAVALALAGTVLAVAPDLLRLRALDEAVRAAARADPGGDVAVAQAMPNEGRVVARKHRFAMALSPDPADGYNRCFARTLQVRSLRAVPPV